MRAKPAVGMNVILKSQEKSSDPVLMQIDSVDEKNGRASVIGFNKDNHPFKIDVSLENLEKANLARLNSMN